MYRHERKLLELNELQNYWQERLHHKNFVGYVWMSDAPLQHRWLKRSPYRPGKKSTVTITLSMKLTFIARRANTAFASGKSTPTGCYAKWTGQRRT